MFSWICGLCFSDLCYCAFSDLSFPFSFPNTRKYFPENFLQCNQTPWKHFPFTEISISGKYVFSGKHFTATKHSLTNFHFVSSTWLALNNLTSKNGDVANDWVQFVQSSPSIKSINPLWCDQTDHNIHITMTHIINDFGTKAQ